MRTLLYIIALLLFVARADAQWFPTTHTAGTVLVGATNVTIAGGGSAATYPLWCGTSPYWIGSGTPSWPGPGVPGWYDYTFSPAVNAIRVEATAMNRGETIEIWINGTPYALSPSEWGRYTGTCGGVTGVALIGGAVECTVDTSFGANASVEVHFCGITSCKVRTSGLGNGTVYNFFFSDSVCFRAQSNSMAGNPWSSLICVGDSLKLSAIGDSIGATYSWTGPGGFTSTSRTPVRFPATMADTGMYMVIRTLGGGFDTSYTRVAIKPLPVIVAASNSPVCVGATNIIALFATPDSSASGETFTWSGPSAYTSTAVNPTRVGVTTSDTGTYRVIASFHGCVDTAYTHVALVPQPPAPIITGKQRYCQGEPFIAFTVTGVTGSLLWYTAASGGVGSTTAPTVPTATPGTYTYWVSQIIGSCESGRSSIQVVVVSVPPAPLITGPLDYCQYIGPVIPLTVTPSDSVKWYTSAIGGTPSWIEPLPNINAPGSLTAWASRVDSGCEGPRSTVTITIHPKPAPPVITSESYCQFKTPHAVIGTPSAAGDVLTWYGPGVTGGYLAAPMPSTSFAPDTTDYYATETSPFGCTSDSAMGTIIIKKKPEPPTVSTIRYCQEAMGARPMNELVDSEFNSHLNWYDESGNTIGLPTPNTYSVPGAQRWWVSQTVPATAQGCKSDSIPIIATLIYKPKFSIEASQLWVCQHDSVNIAYKGPQLNLPEYKWSVPDGSILVNSTVISDSLITVRFDNAGNENIVKLHTTNENGMCYSDTTISIRVIPLPTMMAYTKPDVCLGDTVDLALYTRSDNAYTYEWWVDKTTMETSPAMIIVSSNSHTSGPYTISWVDTGRHIIKVASKTIEGCKSEPTFDSVLVHNKPDATFRITSPNGSDICLEDSVQFTATEIDYRNNYKWAPAHNFDNVNRPVIWGKILQMNHSVITLTVTDPFGCYATKDMQLDPQSCCTISFPNAFTPNGTGPAENNVFRPYFVGYHRFHMFRIANRWGQTIFESANSNVMGWDGTFNGVPQDMGVYYYFLKYDCGGKTLEAKGDVTLIR